MTSPIRSHKENIFQLSRNQHFCQKNKKGQKKVFQAEL